MNGPTSHNEPVPEGLSERELGDLAALADGRLAGRRRSELERRVAGSPGLQAALDRQRSAASALRGVELPAPLRLRERIESARSAPSRPVRRRRLGTLGGIAAAVCAAVLVALLVLPSEGGGPTVVEASGLAVLPATQASVPPDPANPNLLDAVEDGVPFPNLADQFGWREAGARSDQLEGRETQTVFYLRGGRRIGYTILAGDAIDPPADSQATMLNEVELWASSVDGRQVVTWYRDGRTCVLSGEDVDRAELLELASWKAEGAVPF